MDLVRLPLDDWPIGCNISQAAQSQAPASGCLLIIIQTKIEYVNKSTGRALRTRRLPHQCRPPDCAARRELYLARSRGVERPARACPPPGTHSFAAGADWLPSRRRWSPAGSIFPTTLRCDGHLGPRSDINANQVGREEVQGKGKPGAQYAFNHLETPINHQ